MRMITSAWRASGTSSSTSPASSGLRKLSTAAMICGCSPETRSLIARASIHCSTSMPWLLSVGVMRASTAAARPSPSARVNTVRTNASAPWPTPVKARAWPINSSSTSPTVSWLTSATENIAWPSVCTSRGVRLRNTSAAWSSPKSSIRIAHFCAPVSFAVSFAGTGGPADGAAGAGAAAAGGAGAGLAAIRRPPPFWRA